MDAPTAGPTILVPRPAIAVSGNADLTVAGRPNLAKGVVSGSGTASDPFVIEGWNIQPAAAAVFAQAAISIRNTDLHLVVRGNLLQGFTNFGSGAPPAGTGLYVANARNVVLEGNDVRGNFRGVWLDSVTDVTVRGNGVLSNVYQSYFAYRSSGVTLRDNLFQGARYEFGLDGDVPAHFTHDIDASNLVSGGPIRWHVGLANATLDAAVEPAGAIGLVSCANVTVAGHALHHNYVGLLVAWCDGVTLTGLRIEANRAGAILHESTAVRAENLTVRTNTGGLWFRSSPGAFVEHSLFESNPPGGFGKGIELKASADFEVRLSEFRANDAGVDVFPGSTGTHAHASNFEDDVSYGIYESGNVGLVNATDNWWGDPAGAWGRGGQGDRVSTWVVADPHLAAPQPGAGPVPSTEGAAAAAIGEGPPGSGGPDAEGHRDDVAWF